MIDNHEQEADELSEGEEEEEVAEEEEEPEIEPEDPESALSENDSVVSNPGTPLSERELKKLNESTEEQVVAYVSKDTSRFKVDKWLQIPKFKDNLRLARIAVLKSPGAFRHASEALRGNKELTMLAISRRGRLLKHASAELRDDADVVTAAVVADPRAFKHASDRMRARRDLVMAAVSQKADLLKYASTDLRNDKAVVQAAMARSLLALKYSSDRLKADPEMLWLALPECLDRSDHDDCLWQDRALLKMLCAEHYRNMSFLRLLVSQRPHMFPRLPNKVQSNRELAVLAVGHGASLLEVPEPFCDDYSLVEMAILRDSDHYSFQHASERLRGNRELAMLAVGKSGLNLKHVTERLRDDDGVVRAALDQSARAYEILSSCLRADRSLAMLAVSKCGTMLKHAPWHLQSDRTLVSSALKQIAGSGAYISLADISYIPTALLRDESFLLGLQLNAFVLIISMLSGRSCALVAINKSTGFNYHYARTESMCKEALDIPRTAKIELLSGSQTIPRDAELAAWPGACLGCLTELSIRVSKNPRIEE